MRYSSTMRSVMVSIRRLSIALIAVTLGLPPAGLARPDVPEIVGEYWQWRETVDPLAAGADALVIFEAKLGSNGLSRTAVEASMETLRRGLIAEEGEFYDGIYERGPKLDTAPNRLLEHFQK